MRKIDALKTKPFILGQVRLALGATSSDDPSKDEQINPLDSYQLFDLWLRWEGILGYGERLWNLVQALKEIEDDCSTMDVTEFRRLLEAGLGEEDIYEVVDKLKAMGYKSGQIKSFGKMYLHAGAEDGWLLEEFGFV